MSDGSKGDVKSTASELIMDQGSSSGNRNGYHEITVNFNSALQTALANGNFTFTFTSDARGGNPDYNRVSFILEFKNSSNGILSTKSAYVWGKDPSSGYSKGSTDTYANNITLAHTVNNLAIAKVTIRIRVEKTGILRHMDLSARNMRLNIKSNIALKANNLSKVYGNSDPALTWSLASGAVVSGESATSGSLTRASGSAVGTYAISQGALVSSNTSRYNITGFTNGTFTITKRPITVTANNLSKIYGNANPTYTYTIGGSGLASGDSLSGALTRASGENVGTYSITQGTLAASSNYTLTFNSGTFTITQRPITVTATNKSKTYGDADPALTYTYTGSLASGDSFTGALTRASGSNVGTYAITKGTLALNNNYNLTFNNGTFTINKRPITVTATNKSKTYGDTDPALAYTYTGNLASGDSFTGALTRASGNNAGTYAITKGTLALSNNYNLTFNNGTFTINPRPITVTAASKTKVYGNADPALTYTITSGSLVPGDTLSGALSRVAGESVKSYNITQGNLGNSNYQITFVGNTLTITKRPITVTANNISKGRSQTQDPTLTYSITSGNLVGSDALSGVLSRVAGEAVGTYAISIGTLSNSNYTITFVGAIFTIFDDIAPVISAVTADITNWTNGNVVLTVTTYDEDTTIASVTCNNSATTSLGNNKYSFVATANGTYTFKSTDTSNNYSTSSYNVTNIDKVVPTIVFTPSTPSGVWTYNDITFAFVTTAGNSGVKMVEYTNNGGVTWTNVGSLTSYIINIAGDYTYQFRVTSNSSVTGVSAIYLAKIDRDAPIWVGYTLNTYDIVNTATGVILTVQATDASSGVANVKYGSTAFTKNGDYYSLAFYHSGVYNITITDNVGNTKTEQAAIRNIDEKAATISDVTYSDAYTKIASIPLTFKVTDEGDALSDPAGVQAVFVNDTQLTGQGGVYSYTMTENIRYSIQTIDKVGNISSYNIDIDWIFAIIVKARTSNNESDPYQVIGTYTIDDTFNFPVAQGVQNFYYTGWKKNTGEVLIIAFGKEQEYTVQLSDRPSNISILAVVWELEPIYEEITQGDITFKYTGGDPGISFDLPEGLTAGFEYFEGATIVGGVVFGGVELEYPPYIAGNYVVRIALMNDDSYWVGDKAVHLDIEKGILTPTLSTGDWATSVTIFVHLEEAIPGAIDSFQYSINGGVDWSAPVVGNELFIDQDNNCINYVFRAYKLGYEVSEISDPVIVKVDAYEPTIDFTANATNDQWSNHDILFEINYQVGISGLAWIEYQKDDGQWLPISEISGAYKQLDSTNGIESYKFRVTNHAQVVTESQIFISKIDKVIPVVSYTVQGGVSNIWTSLDNIFTVNNSMGCSGISKVEYTINEGVSWLELAAQSGIYTLTDNVNGTTYYKFRTTSNAGLTGESGTFVSRIDKVIPSISFTPSSPSDTWTADDIVFNLTSTAGPSGVKAIHYTLGGGVWNEILGISYTDTSTNIETYQFRVTNDAGVIALSDTFISKIDKQEPTILVSTDYDSSWVSEAVSFTLDVEYGISGAQVRYKTSLDATYIYIESSVPNSYYFELDANINTSYFFEVITGAGLIDTGDTGGYLVRIDKVAPEINYGARNEFGQIYQANEWTDSTITFSFNLNYGESGGTLYYSLNEGQSWQAGGEITINYSGSNPKAPTITLEDNQDRHFSFKLINGAGVSKTVTFGKVRIDKNEPTISVSASYQTLAGQSMVYNGGIWVSRPIKIAITSGGIGLSEVWITYSTDGGESWSDENIINNGSPSAELNITVSQKNDYIFMLTNGVGNYKQYSFNRIWLDTAAPSIGKDNIIFESGVENAKFSSTDPDYAEWYISNVVLGFNINYGLSGGRVEYSYSPTAEWYSEGIINNYQSEETHPTLTITNNASNPQHYYFRVVSGAGVASPSHYTYGMIKVDTTDYYVNISQYVDTVKGTDYAVVNVEGQAFKRGVQADVVIVPNEGYDFKNTTYSDPNATEFSLDIKNANHNISAYFYKHITVQYNDSNQYIKGRLISNVTISVTPSIPGLTFGVEYYQDGNKLDQVPNAMGVFEVKASSNNANYIVDNSTATLTIVYFEGNGSAESPYLVDSIDDFNKINDCYNNPSSDYDYLGANRFTAYYRQRGNIALTSAFNPIASFAGTFDGANYEFTAAALTVTSSFGIVKELNGGTIKNVGVKIDKLTVQTVSTADAGFIAGKVLTGTITHCYAVGAISINSQASVNVGAIAGKAQAGASIEHCFADVTISNTNVVRGNIAGAVGYAEGEAEFSGVYSIGQITLTNADQSNTNVAPFAIALLSSSFADSFFLADNTYFNGSIVNDTFTGVDAADFAVDILECNTIINDSALERAKTVEQLARIKLDKTTLSGTGSAASPFQIYNLDQLNAMDKYLWANFMFMNDIELQGNALGIIGIGKVFSGTLEGSGYAIRNAVITSDSQYVGLFATLCGAVKGLRLVNMEINATRNEDSFTYVGGVAGLALDGSLIEHVIVSGEFKAQATQSKLFLGGLVGLGNGIQVNNSLNNAALISTNTAIAEVGGLAGRLSGAATVSNSYAIGRVDANFTDRGHAGILAGVIIASTLEGSKGATAKLYANSIALENAVGLSADSQVINNVLADYSVLVNTTSYTVGSYNLQAIMSEVISIFAGGMGTSSSPYLIETAAQLLQINNYLSSYFKLTNIISLAGIQFEPIGKGKEFTGKLDGNSKVITNLTDSLFETNAGTVQNLTLGVNYNKVSSEDTVFGAVAKLNKGSIASVIGTGTVNLTLRGLATAIVGGFAGENKGSITYALNNITKMNIIAQTAYVGATVGIAYSGSVIDNPLADKAITVNGGNIRAGIVAGWQKEGASLINYNLDNLTVTLKVKGNTVTDLFG